MVARVIVQDHARASQIMHPRHRDEKLMDDPGIGAVRKSEEELARTHGAQDRSVDALLLAEAHLDTVAALPKAPLRQP